MPQLPLLLTSCGVSMMVERFSEGRELLRLWLDGAKESGLEDGPHVPTVASTFLVSPLSDDEGITEVLRPFFEIGLGTRCGDTSSSSRDPMDDLELEDRSDGVRRCCGRDPEGAVSGRWNDISPDVSAKAVNERSTGFSKLILKSPGSPVQPALLGMSIERGRSSVSWGVGGMDLLHNSIMGVTGDCETGDSNEGTAERRLWGGGTGATSCSSIGGGSGCKS
ncbi:hypothetical protein BC829DRAFT_379372 [Chytridium lagenaria]|nr:hypothetical protein BC829DRAFT_379372 [Chytridium lagenaria]